MNFKKLLNRGMVEWGRTLGYSREDIIGMVEEVYEDIRKTLCKNTAFCLFGMKLYKMGDEGGRPGNLDLFIFHRHRPRYPYIKINPST